MNSDTARAFTPIILAVSGAAVAIVAIVAKPSNEVTFAAFGLSAAALGAAGGVAQSKPGTQIEIATSENTPILTPPERSIELPPLPSMRKPSDDLPQ